jgi:hypothetical protein
MKDPESSSSNKQNDNVIIPILPCPDIRTQVAFYEQLGFEVVEIYTSPNPYAALKFGNVELHFYGSRKIIPAHNSSMCYLKVEDVDAVYNAFATSFKKHTGKIPRSGLPRITKVRDLSLDRRFILTDTGGNTFYIGTPVKANAKSFFRTLQNEEFATKFAVLYDVVYSKEDCSMAEKMLPKYETAKNVLRGLDKAKFLLIELEIRCQLEKPIRDKELKSLLELHAGSSEDWKKVQKRYYAILKED